MIPLLVTGVGPFGRAIFARMGSGGPPGRRLKYFPLPGEAPLGWDELASRFREQVAAELDDLLRNTAMGSESASARLDLVLVADLAEAEGRYVAAVAHQLSTVLRERFAVMFQPSASPEQRGVGLVVVVATPPLEGSARAREAVAEVRALEQWHLGGSAPSPILSRVYLVPSQTDRITLNREDVERGVFLFIDTAFAPSVRDSEPMKERLGVPRDPRRLLGTFSIAAADLDVARVLDAFAWRSAVAGLARLAEQSEIPAQPDRAAALAEDLSLDEWCRPLAACAQRRRSGGRIADAVAEADSAEAEALREARRRVRAMVDNHFAEGDGLRGLGLLSGALTIAADRMKALSSASEGWLPPPPSSSPIAAPNPASTARPSILASSVAALLLAFACFGGAAAIASVAASRSTSAKAQSGVSISAGTGTAQLDLGPLAWGLGCGIAAGSAWLIAGRRRIKRELAAVSPPPPEEQYAGAAEARAATRSIEAAVALRRRRVARDVERLLRDELARLDALRATVLSALQQARERLRALGVELGRAAADDDYTHLFDAEMPLHRALLRPSVLSALWEKNRELRDDETWAAELLRRAWPKEGLREDLPFGAGERWQASLGDQHVTLRARNVFAWPDVAEPLGERLAAFFGTVPRALGFGVRPLRPDGTPERLQHAHEHLVIVPSEGHPMIDRALREHPIPDGTVLSAPLAESRVVVLRTASDFDAASLDAGGN